MLIEVRWDNQEQTIIRWTYHQGWTWNDAYQACEIEARLIDSVDHTVDALGDLRLAHNIPMSALTAVRGVLTGRHPHLGLTVLFGGATFVQVMYGMVGRVYPHFLTKSRIVLAQTEQEAYRLIEQDRRQRSAQPEIGE